MMNNLEERIHVLEDENIKLKHRIADLEKELELCGKNIESTEPITLSNYYCKKYLEIHDEVYRLRLNKLVERENVLKEEYDSFLNQEASVERVLANNEDIKKQMDNIDVQIKNKYYELEKMRFDFSSSVNKVTSEESKITKSTIEVLSRITDLLSSNVSSATIINEIGYTMDILEKTFYPINLNILREKNKLINSLDELNTINQSTMVEIKSLEVSKKELMSKLQDISVNSVENMMSDISLELDKVTKSKEELKELFDILKDQNLRKVQDEIKHLQILEYSNKDVATQMDKIMQTYYDDLSTASTISNIQLKMITELGILSTKLANYENIKVEYDEKLQSYNHLNALLTTVNSNISQMEEYIKKALKAISSKQEYSEIVTRYDGYLTTINLLKQEIQNTQIKINESKEERRLKSLDPYAKATIQKLTEQIKSNEILLSKYKQDLENTNQEVSKIESSERNLKLMKVLRDKKIIESKLPSLYDQQKELVTEVSVKFDELKKLENDLVDYEKTSERVEELKREINN